MKTALRIALSFSLFFSFALFSLSFSSAQTPPPFSPTPSGPGVGTLSGKVTYADGSPVTDAVINLNLQSPNNQNQGSQPAQTAADGTYTLNVPSAGTWNIFVGPAYNQQTGQPANVNWIYPNSQTSVIYTSSGGQTQTLNFTVVKASATISGTILNPDGSVPALGIVFLNIYNSSGFNIGTNLKSDGSFSTNVPSGTFNMRAFVMASAPSPGSIPSQSNTLDSPQMPPVTTTDNSTNNIGTFKLIAKNNTIQGKLTDSSGNGLPNIQVIAFSMQQDGGQGSNGFTTTDSNGNYSMGLIDGNWTVTPQTAGMGGGNKNNASLNSYVYTGATVQQNLAGGKTASNVNFSMVKADATISGAIVDNNNNPVTTSVNSNNARGFIFAQATGNQSSFGPGLGGPANSDGTFSFKVPAGSYKLGVFFPPAAGYSASSKQSVTVTSGGTSNTNIQVLPDNSFISGSLVDKSGNTVTGVQAQVFATNGVSFVKGGVNTTSGTYSINVSAGNWTLGYFVDPSTKYYSNAGSSSNTSISVGNNATLTQNITLQKADSIITGKITLPDGTPAVGAWVSTSNNTGPKGSNNVNTPFSNGGLTDTNGTYSINVPSGQFSVYASYTTSKGFIDPKPTAVVTNANTQTVNMSFLQSDLTLTGTVRLNGIPYQGYITAYSDSNGYSETTETNGTYSLNITKGANWHILAESTDGTKFYKSTLASISSGSGQSNLNFSLAQTSITLPSSVTTTFDATQTQVINLTDGTIITIPAGALASSGNITLTITPNTSIENQNNAIPLTIGYNLTAVNSQGSTLTGPFSQSIEISFPYTDAQLAAVGLSTNSISPSYWDTTNGTWKNVNNIAIDKVNHYINLYTDHFTQFALVGNIDTNPPSVPANLQVNNGTDGKTLNLSWVNPSSSNFNEINIYRSTAAGSLGSKIATTGNNQISTYADTGLITGVTYYYSLTAINFSNYESAATNQVAGIPATAIAAILPNTSGTSLYDWLPVVLITFILIFGGYISVKKVFETET